MSSPRPRKGRPPKVPPNIKRRFTTTLGWRFRAEVRRAGTVADLAEVYLTEHASGKRSGHKDHQILAVHVLPQIGHIGLADIRRPDVAAMLRKVEQAGKPVARNRTLEVVRAMFNFAIRDELERFGILEFNPAAQIRKLHEQGREVWLTSEQIGRYWLAIERLPEPLRSCLKLVVLTAQRQHQILEMRWADIDLAVALWIVPASNTKGSRTQRLPLTRAMLEILEALPVTSPWVFPGRGTDGAAGHTFIHTPARRIRAELDIGDFRLHDWRHTFTSLVAPKAGRHSVSLVLGHIDDGTSTDTYDHGDYVEPRRRALEAWQSIILIAANAALGENVVALT